MRRAFQEGGGNVLLSSVKTEAEEARPLGLAAGKKLRWLEQDPSATTVPHKQSGMQGLESVLGIEDFGPWYKLKGGRLYWREIQYIEEIGKREGSRCQAVVLYQSSRVRITWEALDDVDACVPLQSG